MKILLVAEGPHELHDPNNEATEGALHHFVRRLLPDAAGPVEFRKLIASSPVVQTQLSPRDRRSVRGSLTATRSGRCCSPGMRSSTGSTRSCW